MKRILLFMPKFYDYYIDIISEMKRQNYEVAFYSDEIKLNKFERIYSKINKNYKNKKFDAYFEKCIDLEKKNTYDLIVIIFGALYFKKQHISILRNTFKVPVVYYAWDSVNNFPQISDLFETADIAYSFDLEDVNKYKVNFLPLFYLNNRISNDLKYDYSLIMTFYVEKYDNLNKLLLALPPNLNGFIYLKVRDVLYYIKLKMQLRNKLKRVNKYIRFKKLSKDYVYDIFAKSKVILDCPLQNQNGLTIRTFESLSLNKKIITTNTNIANYDFYSPQNIYIVKDINQLIPLEFFETKFDCKFELSNDYSITSFVKKITHT